MKIQDWKLLSVVVEGESLKIEGVNVWLVKWNSLDVGTLEVPHPSYPQQKHTLWPCYAEDHGKCILFMAGELSNGVWCFYVPRKGQPMQRTKGMTVNEKLYESQLFEPFDHAIRERNKKQATDYLILAGLNSEQAENTVATMIDDH